MEKRSNNKNKDISTLLSLQLYATYYCKFYFLEKALKDRLFGELKKELGENWFSDQLSSLKNPLFKEENKYILHRKPNGFILSDNGLKVESGIGFWVEFFSKSLYKEAKGIPIKIFTKLPSNVKRKEIYSKLQEVKELRNELFHYRIPPVINYSQLKNIKKIEQVSENLTLLLQWLDVNSQAKSVELEMKRLIKKLNGIWG